MLSAHIAIQNLKVSGRGVACVYYQVDDTTGIKTYSGRDGKREYRKSRLAYRYGIGPKVWGYEYNAETDKSAFYVQHVNIVGDVVRRNKSFGRLKLADEVQDWSYHNAGILIDTAVAIGDKYGIATDIFDLHTDNIGVIDGKPVVVDFSHCRIGRIGFYDDEDEEAYR